ncbi:MAG: hypothetical protein V3V72_13455 [Ignavibacteriaceae bacterium]
MIFTLKHIGAYGGFASKIIELTVESNGSTIIEDITGLNSKVEETLIIELRQIADELEEHNIKLKD